MGKLIELEAHREHVALAHELRFQSMIQQAIDENRQYTIRPRCPGKAKPLPPEAP